MESSEKYLYEEWRKIPQLWSWVIVLGLALFLVLSGIVVHGLIPDRDRHWDYGALDTIPGSSVYSTMTPAPIQVKPAETGKVPNQIQPLPEADPLVELPPIGYEREE